MVAEFAGAGGLPMYGDKVTVLPSTLAALMPLAIVTVMTPLASVVIVDTYLEAPPVTFSQPQAFAAGGVPGVPPGAQIYWGEIDCSLFELLAAALPLAAAAVVYRRNPSPGMLAQAAAAGALAGQAALHIACPGRHDVVHLWVFHVAGVGAAALLGLLLEGQLKSARS